MNALRQLGDFVALDVVKLVHVLIRGSGELKITD
jgi:hypothetical protein